LSSTDHEVSRNAMCSCLLSHPIPTENPIMEEHPFFVVRNFLFGILTDITHIWRPYPPYRGNMDPIFKCNSGLC